MFDQRFWDKWRASTPEQRQRALDAAQRQLAENICRHAGGHRKAVSDAPSALERELERAEDAQHYSGEYDYSNLPGL